MTKPVERGQHRRSCRRCGWSATYPTARMADWQKRRHNCERQPVCPDCGGPKARVSQRCANCAKARLDVDRTPKPCLHKRANHQHGTHACYALDGCRCEPCAKASGEYESNRQRLHAYGRWDGWVDSDIVRAHIDTLLAANMSGKRIMAEAGLSSGAWTKLVYGVQGRERSKRTRRDVAERILALQPSIAEGRYVDVLGVSRRLQALVALGWSQAKLAERLGLLPSNVTAMVHGRGKVTYRRRREVCALYDALSMTLPPPGDTRAERIAVNRARNYAKAHGWLPPLAWDEEFLDLPRWFVVDSIGRCRVAPAQKEWTRRLDRADRGGVDHAVVERFIESGERVRKLTRPEAAEAARRLRLAGKSTTEMENRYGLKPERYKEGKGA